MNAGGLRVSTSRANTLIWRQHLLCLDEGQKVSLCNIWNGGKCVSSKYYIGLFCSYGREKQSVWGHTPVNLSLSNCNVASTLGQNFCLKSIALEFLSAEAIYTLQYHFSILFLEKIFSFNLVSFYKASHTIYTVGTLWPMSYLVVSTYFFDHKHCGL